MTGKIADNKQWTDPKDYGLPYVEVVPLSQAEIPQKEKEMATAIDVAEIKKKTIQAVKPTFSDSERISRTEYKLEEKKKSSSWVWIAATLALAVVAVIVWQMNKSVVPNNVTEVTASESATEIEAKENSDIAVNNSQIGETQTSENSGEVLDTASSVSPANESVQTGTTIDNNAASNLIRVTEKGSRPQFYIVVGSLPSEALAMKEASQYFDRAETIYLIMPYEDSENYRLAIDRSIGFTAMTEELELVKDQYSEALWILKY